MEEPLSEAKSWASHVMHFTTDGDTFLASGRDDAPIKGDSVRFVLEQSHKNNRQVKQ